MSTAKIVTPPLRSVAGEALSPADISLHFPEKSRDRSSSASSSTSNSSSSSSFSDSSFPVPGDYLSSNDEIHQFQERLRSLGRLMPLASLNLSAESPPPISECVICLEESSIRPLSCCSSSICASCLSSHLSSHIREARIRIVCPSCPHIFTREEILQSISARDIDGQLTELYKRFYADINGEAHIKTCPRCCAIKEIDPKIFQSVRWRRLVPRRVTCDECQFVWCFFCHSPWHAKMSCKEFREGEKMLRAWASKKEQNQHNAQRCPRCKVFISRNGGCPHMVCSKCRCDFCYNCGKRRFSLRFLGSHESRFSPFGCKYNLYPNKPVLRHTVRGLVAGAATLAAPVAAVGAVALLAVGTTIGAPTYGTYLLVKHIRKKRNARREIPVEPTPPTPENNDDDEDEQYRRAFEASLISYGEEMSRRNHFSSSDDDDEDEV